MSGKGLSSSRWAIPRSSSVPATRKSNYTPPAAAITESAPADADSSSSRRPTPTPTPTPKPVPVSIPGVHIPDPKLSSVIPLTVSQKEAPRAEAELSRYLRIVRRMKWKLPFLAQGYQQATDPTNTDAAGEADMMFKLDFFEYYMLLERALVHLQAVFNIVITGNHAPSSTSSSSSYTNGKGLYTHRYHANVLEALDSMDNPLHGALGKGEVRRALSRAKDLRNRWKNVDAADREQQVPNLPLQTYDLETILMTVYAGLDQACIVATNYVSELKAIAAAAARASVAAKFSWADEMETPTPGREDGPSPFGEWPVQDHKVSEEAEWQFMFDAMDWQAI